MSEETRGVTAEESRGTSEPTRDPELPGRLLLTEEGELLLYR